MTDKIDSNAEEGFGAAPTDRYQPHHQAAAPARVKPSTPDNLLPPAGSQKRIPQGAESYEVRTRGVPQFRRCGIVWTPDPQIVDAKDLAPWQELELLNTDTLIVEELGADGNRLRGDGPTLEEFVAAGKDPAAYPPRGYAVRPSPGLDAHRARVSSREAAAAARARRGTPEEAIAAQALVTGENVPPPYGNYPNTPEAIAAARAATRAPAPSSPANAPNVPTTGPELDTAPPASSTDTAAEKGTSARGPDLSADKGTTKKPGGK